MIADNTYYPKIFLIVILRFGGSFFVTRRFAGMHRVYLPETSYDYGRYRWGDDRYC